MAAPTEYDRQYNFTQHSVLHPSDPHPGDQIDAEFNAVKLSLDDTQASLSQIQDSDGALARGSVGRAQFDASVTLGFGSPKVWSPGVQYDADVSTVFRLQRFYICVVTHTSGAEFNPEMWSQIADFSLSATLEDGSVTAEKLALDSVTTAKIEALAVTTAKIGNENVTTAKLAPTSVTTAKLADASVTTDKIATRSITRDKVALAAIVDESIADGSITLAKVTSEIANRLVPAGAVVAYGGASAPAEWLLCFGQAVSRDTYSALYTAIGTTYGAGDGSTTFNLPDLRGRVPAGQDDMGGTSANRLTAQPGGLNGDTLGAVGGAETHTVSISEMPTHRHRVRGGDGQTGNNPGLTRFNAGVVAATDFSTSGETMTDVMGGTGRTVLEDTGGGQAHNNVQPTIILNYIIKAH